MKKTEDNLAVIENANEQVKLISDKYLPKIKKWLQDVAKISSNNYKVVSGKTCFIYYLNYLFSRRRKSLEAIN